MNGKRPWKRADMVPVVVRMPPDLHAAIREQAAREERSMAQLMRFALRQYVAAAVSGFGLGEDKRNE